MTYNDDTLLDSKLPDETEEEFDPATEPVIPHDELSESDPDEFHAASVNDDDDDLDDPSLDMGDDEL